MSIANTRFDMGALEPLRLDRAENPYGPTLAVSESIEILAEMPVEALRRQLRQRISRIYRVPVDSIVLLDCVDKSLARIAAGWVGPMIGFPPSATASYVNHARATQRSVWITRGTGLDAGIDPESASDLPESALALVDSPADPLGSILRTADAVRLARACRCLVVDERFAEFAGSTLVPLAIEFENVLVLRSFEPWTGLRHHSCAWAVGSVRAAEVLEPADSNVSPMAVAAAVASLDNFDSAKPTLRLIREERSRLYRFLRKLSFLAPLPSWGPFIAARVEIGSRDAFVNALAERGVKIHAPTMAGLEQYVRIGIGTPSSMEQLRSRLIQLAPEIVDQELKGPPAQ